MAYSSCERIFSHELTTQCFVVYSLSKGFHTCYRGSCEEWQKKDTLIIGQYPFTIKTLAIASSTPVFPVLMADELCYTFLGVDIFTNVG